MKEFWILLIILLLPISLASGEEPCEHEWSCFEPVYGYLAEEVQWTVMDDDCHECVLTVPESICTRCGTRQYSGSIHAIANRHAYFVSDWYDQHDGTKVTITWVCSLCKFERKETVLLETIIDGSGETCLLGGKCDVRRVGYMHEDGYLYDSGATVLPDFTLPNDAKRLFYEAVLAHNGEMGIELSLVSRTYCSQCGRPSVKPLSGALQSFEEQWSGMGVYTEDAYLQVDMPQNLPYQLIDQLRQEAAAE